MHISQLASSRFLKKEDCEGGILSLTIVDESYENVALQEEPEDMKCVLWFAEIDKGWVLNKTNAEVIASIVGMEDTSDWVAKNVQVDLFNDKKVVYKGRVIGGLRVHDARVTNPDGQRLPQRQQQRQGPAPSQRMGPAPGRQQAAPHMPHQQPPQQQHQQPLPSNEEYGQMPQQQRQAPPQRFQQPAHGQGGMPQRSFGPHNPPNPDDL